MTNLITGRAWLVTLCVMMPRLDAIAADAQKPNIVVIVADDLGYADVRFNPLHPREVGTPHLDAFARESVICRQGYVRTLPPTESTNSGSGPRAARECTIPQLIA